MGKPKTSAFSSDNINLDLTNQAVTALYSSLLHYMPVQIIASGRAQKGAKPHVKETFSKT